MMKNNCLNFLKFVVILWNMEWNFKFFGIDKDNFFKYFDKMDLV